MPTGVVVNWQVRAEHGSTVVPRRHGVLSFGSLKSNRVNSLVVQRPVSTEASSVGSARFRFACDRSSFGLPHHICEDVIQPAIVFDHFASEPIRISLGGVLQRGDQWPVVVVNLAILARSTTKSFS